MPFDWRLIPEDLDDTWGALQASIESAVKATGRKAILVSHSYGGLLAQFFLTQFVTESWKVASHRVGGVARCSCAFPRPLQQTYIHKWIACAAPFAGAPIATKALLSGYDFGIPIVSSADGLEIGPNIGAVFMLNPRPQPGAWQLLVSLVQGNTASNFSASELGALLDKVGLAQGSTKLRRSTGSWSYADPNVPVVLAVGTLVDTGQGLRAFLLCVRVLTHSQQPPRLCIGWARSHQVSGLARS